LDADAHEEKPAVEGRPDSSGRLRGRLPGRSGGARRVLVSGRSGALFR